MGEGTGKHRVTRGAQEQGADMRVWRYGDSADFRGTGRGGGAQGDMKEQGNLGSWRGLEGDMEGHGGSIGV